MPELPEVETCLRGITPLILKQQISQVIIRQAKLRWPVPSCLVQGLPGQTITKLKRRAKYLLMHADNGTLILHLGMSACLRIVAADTPAQVHDHVDIIFTNQSCLRFTDPRRFGALLWTDEPAHIHPLLLKLGPEPLSDAFDADYLYQRTIGRKAAIKSLLLNSNIVAGIGNIYAAEALFQARIHPQLAGGDITLPRYARLVKAIKQILSQAIKQGGTTLKDFYQADGKPGYFRQQLHVYGRDGLACPRCRQTLRKLIISNRSTVYCHHCQRR